MARRRGGLIGGQGGYQEQIKQGKFDKANPSGSLKKDVEKFDKNRKNTVTNTVRRIVNQQPSASPQMQVVASNLRNSGFDPTSIKPKYRDMISRGNTPNIFEQVRKGENIFDPLGFKQKREERDRKAAAAAVSITSKEDWYNSIDRSFGAGRGNKLSDFLAFQEKAKYRFLDRGKKPDSIKGLVEDAVEQMTGSSLTREMDEVNTALNGYYSYGITLEEWQKWQDENTYEIEVKGHKERRLKANCELPPMRYDAEGNVVSKERQEQLRKIYEDVSLYSAGAQHFATEAEKKKKDEKKRSKYTANYNDTETQNSYADVFLDALNDDTNKYKSPWSYSTTGGEYFKSNDFGPKFFKDLWKYHKKYIFKPLQEGDFLVLGNNVLTNLGETLDIGARGAKAFQYGDRGIYGTKSGMTNLKNDQWVYGSGTDVSEKKRKKTQKELIELGALEAINGGSGLRVGGALGASHSSKKEIEKRIKEAGLWDEYKQFRKEYLSEDFNSFKTRAESVKKAYTTKRREHYDVDTGNVFLDMGVEMLSDPTVVLSAGAALGRRASKTGAESLAHNLTVDLFREAGIEDNKALNKLTREYGKQFADTLLSKSRSDIARDIRDLRWRVGRVYGNAEYFVEGTEGIADEVLKDVTKQLNSYSFRFVNSLNKLDDVVDQVDRFLLKSVFDLPYVSYKTVKVPFNIMRRTSREARHVNRRLVAEARRNMINSETGRLDVFSYEKIDSDAVDDSIKDVVSQEIVANTEIIMREMQRIVDDCAVQDADQVYKRLDAYVKGATGGKANTYTEFLEYVDNLPFGNKSLDELRDLLKRQKVSIDKSYHQAQFRNNRDYVQVLQDIIHEGNHTVDEIEELINNNLYLISDRGLRENLIRMQDDVRFIEDPVERLRVYDESIEAMLDVYRKENVFYSMNLTSRRMHHNVKKEDLLVDNQTKIPIDDSTALGSKSKAFFTMLLGGKYPNAPFRELYNLIVTSGGKKEKIVLEDSFAFDIDWGDLEKVTLVEILEPLQKGIRNLEQKKIILNNQKEAAELRPFETGLLAKAKAFNDEILAQEKLGMKLNAEQDIIELQEDIAHRFFSFMQNNVFRNSLLKMTSSDTLLGKYVVRLKSSDVSVVGVKPGDELSEESQKRMKLFDRLSVLITTSERYAAFNHLMERLTNSSLSFEKQKGFIETFFGSQSGHADNYMDAYGPSVNQVMQKTNTHMVALYGEDKVALDSFRKQVTDFNGDLYQDLRGRFGDVIDDENVQERIRNICRGGHLNPEDDVRVAMLQNIVRDPSFAEQMNEYAKVQPVVITDLETFGTNTAKDDIISIATFDWDNLEDASDFNSVLDFIESKERTKLYSTKMTEEYVEDRIDPEVIYKMFEHDPRVGSVDDAKALFKEAYCTSDVEALRSEYDMLMEYITDLDNKAVAYRGAVPKLVVHNNNGFDLNMLFSRLSNPDYLMFPQHIKNLDALQKNSYNMLQKVVERQGNILLTKSEENELREILSEYARSIGHGETMSVVDVDELCSTLDEILELMEDTQGNAIKNRASKEVSELPIDGNIGDDLLLDEDLYRSLQELRSSLKTEIDEIYKKDLSYSFIKDTHKGNQFEGYAQNSMMKELNQGRDAELLQVGYNVIMSKGKAYKFFDVADTEVTFIDLKRMGNLAKTVDRAVKQRMKDNVHIYSKVVQDKAESLIKFAREHAALLSDEHECAFWRYLNVPDNAAEKYALAKVLYDRLNYTLNNFVGFDKEELLENGRAVLNRDYKQMSYAQRQAVVEYAAWGYDFVKFSLLDDGTVKMYFEDPNILYDIFKDSPKPNPRKYAEAIKEESRSFKYLGDRLRSGTMSLGSVLQGSISKTLTSFHNARLRAINGITTEAADLFDEIAENLDETTREEVIDIVGELYRVNKEKQNLQILSYINQSEDNLLSHLLFHGKFLVVPAKGSANHILEFNKLRELLKGVDESKIYSEFDGAYLFVGIHKNWEGRLQIDKDGRTIREDAEMFFGDEQKAYTAPQYKLLGYDSDFVDRSVISRFLTEKEAPLYWMKRDALEAEYPDKTSTEYITASRELAEQYGVPSVAFRCLDYMEHYEHHMANLTGGMSIGSLGFLHDTSTTQRAYANLSDSFKRNTLSEEYVNNERWTHTPNMQMCFLGDADNCWHVGKVDVEETDVLFGTFDTLVRTSNRASTEACYLDFLFNENDALNINNLLEGVSEEEFIEELARNEDISVVALFDANTDTGYEIKELKIETKADLEEAKKYNAKLMDYASYMDMAESVNRITSNSELFKWWARFATIQKQVVLFRPMTWVRNAIDAYTKGVIDTKTPAALSANIIKAGRMLHQYKRINRIVETSRGLYHNTEEDIRRNFDGIVQAAFGNKTDKVMDFETYQQLDDWMNAGRSGGLSRQALEIDKQVKRGRAWKDKTKSRVSGRDVVSSDYAKVRGMTSEEVSRLYDNLSQAEKNIMDKDTFLGIHSESKLNVSDVQLTQYEKLLDSIVYGYRDNTLNWNSLKRVTARTYDKVSNAALFGMSYAEEHLRLAQYLTLADQGFSESAIHRHIVDSQFDTTIKSQSQKILETVVPFYSFAKSNMSFWAGLVQKDPTSLRMLEHIFSQLSWNMDEMDPNDYYSMQQIMSGNLNADLLPDNPFFDMTGWFKLNPSVMDAFNMAWGPGQKFVNLLYPPFKAGLGYAAYESGADLAAIFGRDFGTQWQDMSIYESLPIVAPLHSLAENPMSLIDTGLRFSKDQFEQNSFELYCSDLEKQGMYWNSLTGKPEPLELKSGTDLDYQGLSFAYRKWYEQTQRGRLWDSNVHAWVPVSDYTFGGLNKEWDFSKPGQFDIFCKEYEKRFDKKWDNNQGKFVDPKDYIPGMLNRKDLSWKEVLYYHKKMFPDERWDANQGKFVPKEEYIPGGLNSKDLSWNELCALKYHLRGEEWNYEEHRWEKTHEPDIEILSYEYHTTLNQDFDKTIDKSKHSESFLDRMKLIAYADSKEKGAAAALNDILSGMRMQSSLLRTMNPKALTGNPANDAAVLGAIMDKAAEYDKQRSYPYKKFDRSYNYRSGRAGDVTFRKTSFVPSKQNFVQLYGNPGLQINHKRYNDPFSFGNDNSGLRMAVSKYAAYDTYYSYEYSKLYHKTGTKDVLAHYPQTSEAIQRYGNRFNNTYKANGYYRGIYTAANFKGLSTTIRNNLREQNKLHDYQH